MFTCSPNPPRPVTMLRAGLRDAAAGAVGPLSDTSAQAIVRNSAETVAQDRKLVASRDGCAICEDQDRMKKIAFLAFLLAVCVAAGRAQESRQDISISGTALIQPFMASSTDCSGALQPRLWCVGQLSLYAYAVQRARSQLRHHVPEQYSAFMARLSTTAFNVPARVPRRFRALTSAPSSSRTGIRSLRPVPARTHLPAHRQLRPTDSRHQAADGGRRPVRRRLRLRDQPQLRHPRRISRIGGKSAYLRRGRSYNFTTNKWFNMYEPTVGVAYHF